MSITAVVENDTIKLPMHVPDGTRVEITLPTGKDAPVRPRVGERTSAPVRWSAASFAPLDEAGMQELGLL